MIDAVRVAVERAVSRWRLSISVIFVIALLARVVVALWMPNSVAWEDGHRYIKVADNLLNGRGFGGIWDNSMSVPTQPLLLAALSLVFGKYFTAYRLFMALVGAVSCVFGAQLGRRLAGPATGLLTGLLLAVYPPLVYLSALFEYPQALFILLMGAFFLLFYRSLDTGKWWTLAVAGLALGTSVLTVPTVLAFVPMLLLTMWLLQGRRAILRWAVIALFAAVPLTAWGLRNLSAYGEFILVNKSASQNFWTSNNETYYEYGKAGVVPACGPGYEFTSFCLEHTEMVMRVWRSGVSDIEAVNEHDRAGWQHGIAFVRASPLRYVKLMVRKYLLFWNPVPDSVQLSDTNVPRGREVVSLLTYGPVLLLGILGVWWTRTNWRRLLTLWVYVAAFSAPYSILLPVMRYRLPLDFILVLFAACALVRLLALKDSVRATGLEPGLKAQHVPQVE